jgi:hypothetical protein
MLPLKQNNPEVNYYPTRISGEECFWRKYHAASKGEILLGTWNVRSLYRAGSLTATGRELARYK